MKNELENKIMQENLFFALASQTSVFVIDDRVYYVSKNEESKGKFKGKIVIEGPSLEVLERLTENKLKKDYEEYKKEFIFQEIKQKKQNKEKITDRDDLAERDNYKKLLNFVVNEMFPYLRKDNSQALDSLLEAPVEKEELKIEPENVDQVKLQNYIKKRISEQGGINFLSLPKESKIETLVLNSKISLSSNPCSKFSDVLRGCNFAVYKNKVYALASVGVLGELLISGRKYSLVPLANLEELKTKYFSEVKRRMTVETLEKDLAESPGFRAIFEKNKGLGDLANKDSYSEQDFGFTKKGSRIMVYVEVPDYVLEDPIGGGLYLFNKHRIGLDLYLDYGHPAFEYGPRPVGNVAGPFYGGSSLCMGSYSTGYFNRMSKGKAFAKYLVDARNVVLHGYTARVGPVHPIANFYNRKISAEQVKKRGLTITNASCRKQGRLKDDDY